MRLILASASPRRAELLRTAGIAFSVAAADVDETPRPGEEPRAYAVRVARAKAVTVSERVPPDAPVLAADTVVVAGGRLLGKPADDREARTMLELLSGAEHYVLTAVVLRTAAAELVHAETTRVRFAPLSAAELDWYVASGEPDGKAGAYAIQGLGSRFVEWIEGSWSNVVGLPVSAVYRLLARAGVLC